jgi:hypothetical protein
MFDVSVSKSRLYNPNRMIHVKQQIIFPVITVVGSLFSQSIEINIFFSRSPSNLPPANSSCQFFQNIHPCSNDIVNVISVSKCV